MNDLKRKSNSELQQILEQGAVQLGLTLNPIQIKQLLEYIYEFDKWNKTYNLSAIRVVEHMVSRHLLDSLSVVPHLLCLPYSNMGKIIDVGTGGGLPGIPLAIMFPERRFTLLDSNGKKARFLFHVKTLLGLHNVTVENRRVEQFQPAQKFQIVISRAFASLQDMTEGCAHLLVEGGVFMAMKGVYPEDELQPLAAKIKLQASHQLVVPNSEGERHLLILKPVYNNPVSREE